MKSVEKNTFLNTLSFKVYKIGNEWFPGSFSILIILTLMVILGGVLIAPSQWKDVPLFWLKGCTENGILVFTAQMSLALLTGHMVACSQPVRNLIHRLIARRGSPQIILIFTVLFALFTCYIHWAIGLIASGIFVRMVGKIRDDIHYPLLAASAFSGYLVWHAGLSAVAPLMMATEKHLFSDIVAIVPISETTMTSFNFLIIIGFTILLPVITVMLHPTRNIISAKKFSLEQDDNDITYNHLSDDTLEQQIHFFERTGYLTQILSILLFLSLFMLLISNNFKLDLNVINLFFLAISLTLYKSVNSFSDAVKQSGASIGNIVLQFPLYGGILSIMKESGTIEFLTNYVVTNIPSSFYPLFTLLNAGLINLFIPSGGGQWIVQGEFVLRGAQILNASIPLSVLAFSWGDAWTNMLQPFWALPLLAMCGLKIRHIAGYTFLYFIIGGIWLVIAFTILHHLFY